MNKSRVLTVLGAALLLSLAANIYFGGMSLGHMMAGPSCDRKEWREKEAVLQERLSPQDYAILKEHKGNKKKAFRADKAELEKARDEVDRAMRAEPFDADVLKAALASENDVKLRVLQRMRESRDKLSAELSPEGRKIFAEVMKEFRRKPGEDSVLPGDTPRPPSP